MHFLFFTSMCSFLYMLRLILLFRCLFQPLFSLIYVQDLSICISKPTLHKHTNTFVLFSYFFHIFWCFFFIFVNLLCSAIIRICFAFKQRFSALKLCVAVKFMFFTLIHTRSAFIHIFSNMHGMLLCEKMKQSRVSSLHSIFTYCNPKRKCSKDSKLFLQLYYYSQ